MQNCLNFHLVLVRTLYLFWIRINFSFKRGDGTFRRPGVTQTLINLALTCKVFVSIRPQGRRARHEVIYLFSCGGTGMCLGMCMIGRV